jgi:hypothetical protein
MKKIAKLFTNISGLKIFMNMQIILYAQEIYNSSDVTSINKLSRANTFPQKI